MSQLRQSPLRKSLHRTNLLLGGERVPMLLVILAAAMLIFVGMTLLTTLLGVLIFLGGTAGLRAAAAVHPQMTKVYARSMKYRSYYPARVRLPTPMPYVEVMGDQD